MAKANASSPYALSGDRPPTPPGNCARDNDLPHPLKANAPDEPTKENNADNAPSRRMPVNPPSSPAILFGPCYEPSSATSTHGMPRSPLSPPATPPPINFSSQNQAAFRFSRRLMKSKKLSSAVHGTASPLSIEQRTVIDTFRLGTLTQPVIYHLSDDE